MTNDNDNPTDTARTNRAHAGEAIEDARNWPGYGLIALGLVLMALSLVAAGGGFEGWAFVLVPACVLSFVAGAVLVILEHRRVKNREGLSLSDPQGH